MKTNSKLQIVPITAGIFVGIVYVATRYFCL